MKMRNKLMAASVMLVISIIMMSTASFAWFSISTNPQISQISGSVVVNENLEIALHGGKTPAPSSAEDGATGKTTTEKNMTWGNFIDLGTTELTLKPLELGTDGKTLKKPVYGDDGRISSLEEVTGEIDTETGLFVYKIGEEIAAVRIDLWVRTNMTGTTIKFSEAANRGIDEVTGSGSLITMTAGELSSAVKIKTWVGTALATTPTAAAADTRTPNFTTDATIGEDGKITGDIIANATADAIYPVSILVYLDGTTVTNADVDATQTFTLDIQLTNGSDEPMVP